MLGHTVAEVVAPADAAGDATAPAEPLGASDVTAPAEALAAGDPTASADAEAAADGIAVAAVVAAGLALPPNERGDEVVPGVVAGAVQAANARARAIDAVSALFMVTRGRRARAPRGMRAAFVTYP